MCTTLPPVLVTVLGIEKLVPTFADLEVFLQLLPTLGDRRADEPVHLAVDGRVRWRRARGAPRRAARQRPLAGAGRRGRPGQALHCIRCSACLNVCPVYSRTGGHAYGSVYPGPIGAILTPQLVGIENAPSLPFASSLCGACYEVCPVKIDIPRVLLHLRRQAVQVSAPAGERAAMGLAAWMFAGRRRFTLAQRLGLVLQRPFLRDGMIRRLPGPLAAWTRTRDLKPVARRTFRERWKRRRR